MITQTDSIWKNAQPSELMDSKLRVVFEHTPAAEYGGDKTPPRVSSESKSATGGFAAVLFVALDFVRFRFMKKRKSNFAFYYAA